MFGPHLTLDLYGCNKKKISDANFIFNLLDELPELIDMHKISEPQIMIYPGKPNSFDKGGVSGFVIIAESHIAIHTFVEQEYASVDIFSCKSFDVKKTEEILVDKLEAKKVEKNLIMRGREFPKDIEKAARVTIKQRTALKRC